jgi:hypothetical protein
MVGVEEDDNEALFCEDGSIEPMKRGPAILPVVVLNGSLITRNEVSISQELAEGCLPIPSVIWTHDTFTLHMELFAHGEPNRSAAYVQYTLSNRTDEAISENSSC